MPGQALTTASSLSCPHGGRVVMTTSNRKALAGGAPLVSARDPLTIVGCPFQLPGPTPSPCLTVEWTTSDRKVQVGGGPTLSTASIGVCKAGSGAPQGPVVIASTQPKASTT